MRGRAVVATWGAGLAAVTVLMLAGCASLSGGAADTSLRFVERMKIDQDGNAVTGVAVADPPAGPVDPAGDSNAVCPPLSIAVAGPLQGDDAVFGVDVKNGIQLAVDKHNDSNPGCQVQLKDFDTQGDPQRAVEMAEEVVEDAFTIGLIGPALSDEALAMGGILDRAGMVAVTPTATDVALSAQGWRTFFRGLANNGVQGIAVANYLRQRLDGSEVCVVDDGSDYGLGLAQAVRETLGTAVDSACGGSLAPGAQDYSDTVSTIAERSPGSVFFAGYYAEAAELVRQLRDSGVGADFASGDGSFDAEFINRAGESARGAVVSCPCGPVGATFAEQYEERFGQSPGAYSAGGYDLGTILLRGIDSGAITRPALLEFVRNYDGVGLERSYRWEANGELVDTTVWVYQVDE